MSDARGPREPVGPNGLPASLDPRGPAPRLARPARPASPLRDRVDAGRGRAVPVPPPPPPGRHRRSRGRTVGRVLGALATALSVAVVSVSAGGYVLYRKYDGQIDRLPGLTKALPGLQKPADDGGENILLVGSDSREGLGDEFQGTGAEFTTGQRSDTIILAHLYGSSQAAQLVSFPRDSYVSIPAYTDPKSGDFHPQRMDKINSAMDEGGPALLIATVERLTQVRVDHYVQVDFAGFQDMVAELGGVEVCLKNAVKEPFSGIDLPAGRQTVTGLQALAFVRQRKELPNGDIDRIRRQQAFIGSIARKALSSKTLFNPGRLNGFLNAATRSVQTDEGLDGTELGKLALRLRDFSAGGVVFTTAPYTTISATRNGQSVVLLDEVAGERLYEGLRRDIAPGSEPAPTATPQPLTVAPSAVTVTVLNGAGTAGLGSRAAADLVRVGFKVPQQATNRGTGAEETVVRYGPSRADSARTLAAAVPGALLQLDTSLGSTVELVVGSSYDGAVRVSAGQTPSAEPGTVALPSASPSAPPTTTAADADCVD